MPSSDEPLEIYVKAFVLSGGNLGAAEQARHYARNINRIRRACREEGPSVYAVHARGIERLWPREGEAS